VGASHAKRIQKPPGVTAGYKASYGRTCREWPGVVGWQSRKGTEWAGAPPPSLVTRRLACEARGAAIKKLVEVRSYCAPLILKTVPLVATIRVPPHHSGQGSMLLGLAQAQIRPLSLNPNAYQRPGRAGGRGRRFHAEMPGGLRSKSRLWDTAASTRAQGQGRAQQNTAPVFSYPLELLIRHVPAGGTVRFAPSGAHPGGTACRCVGRHAWEIRPAGKPTGSLHSLRTLAGCEMPG
jgi:hypothetical protein